MVDAIRSPIGRHNGALSSVRPDDPLAKVLRALVGRSGLDPGRIEDVYAGCGNQAGEDNHDVARMAALLAGFPVEVSGITVNRNCSLGLDAVNLAAKSILAGEGDIVIGAGVESLSWAPWSLPKPERSQPVDHVQLWDTTIGWRYNNPRMEALYPIISLGKTAENIAQEMGISRGEQDLFALESHRRVVDALNAGKFKDEIVPIEVAQRKAPPLVVDIDEYQPYCTVDGAYVLDTSLGQLARLRPVFLQGGTVTAGNASGINDGAALLLVSADTARALDLKPTARWLGSAVAGVNPGVMSYDPVPATQELLGRLGLHLEQIGLIELNEAFAAQALGVMRRLGLRHEVTNVNEGAIALGHPVGCSGARILTTLVQEMGRRAPQEGRPSYGLATLCVGVGMGYATLVEWLN